jgi:hypothetical protein
VAAAVSRQLLRQIFIFFLGKDVFSFFFVLTEGVTLSRVKHPPSDAPLHTANTALP